MEIRKHIALVGLLIYFFGVTFALTAQTSSQKEEELNQIIHEAILNIYTDPIEVIKIGDSLYNNPSNDINEKVTGLLLITDAFIAIRNYPKAHQYMNSAKKLLEKDISSILKIRVLNRFAYQHFQLNLYDEALRYLVESEELNQANVSESMYLTNKGYINAVRGLIYRQLVGCDVAIRYFQRSIKAYEESEDRLTKMNLSIVQYNIGNCYIALEQYEEAKNHFEIAFQSADKYGSPENSLKLFAQKGMASYYHSIEQYKAAIDILNTLNDSAEKIGDKSLMRSVSEDLASNYLEIDSWELYEKHNKAYKEINKELKDFEISATMFALEDIDVMHQYTIQKTTKKFFIKTGSIFLLSIAILFLLVSLILKKRKKINTVRIEVFKTKN